MHAMAVPSLSVLAFAVIVCVGLYRWLVQPVLLSPLARVSPIHWSARVSRLWILRHRMQLRETFAVHEAHTRLGPIVRLAPSEVSVNSIEAVRAVYGGGFPKDDWYANIFTNYGIQPMFTLQDNEAHARRRKGFGSVYAKSTLMSSKTFATICNTLTKERLMQHFNNVATTGEVVELHTMFFALGVDFVSAHCFGLKAGSDLLQDIEVADKYANAYRTLFQLIGLPQEFPGLTHQLDRWGLSDRFLPPVIKEWEPEPWCLAMQDAAEADLERLAEQNREHEAGNWPTVYAQLRNTLLEKQCGQGKSTIEEARQRMPSLRLEIATEMLDHIFAGFDTFSTSLLYVCQELCRQENHRWRDRLRVELSTLPEDAALRELDGLPVLQAVITETLRLYPPAAGNLVRASPPTPTLLRIDDEATVTLPPNTRIHAQAYSLHRNSAIFGDPECWKPERWLDSDPEQLKEMNRWFWAFGSGPRTCIGTNLAMLELKTTLASIWRSFTMEVVDASGMEQSGGFVGSPRGNDGTYLKVKISRLSD